jgi:hypothetical protein
MLCSSRSSTRSSAKTRHSSLERSEQENAQLKRDLDDATAKLSEMRRIFDFAEKIGRLPEHTLNQKPLPFLSLFGLMIKTV